MYCVYYTGSPQIEPGTDHPDVLAAIEEEAKSARIPEFPITVEMYMTALKEGIDQARARTKEIDPGGTRWVRLIHCITLYGSVAGLEDGYLMGSL